MPLFGSPKSTPASSIKSPRVPPENAVKLPSADPPSNGATPAKHDLSADQQIILDKIIDHLKEPGYALPTDLKHLKSFWKHQAKDESEAMKRTHSDHARGATDASHSTMSDHHKLDPLNEREKAYLTTEQIQRCCRAVRWDLHKSIARVEEILVWRRDYGVDHLTGAEVAEESKSGKEYIIGYDKQSRPIRTHLGIFLSVLSVTDYMHPDRQNTKESPRQIQFVVYMLERTVDLMPPGVENLCLNIDFGSSHGGGQPTSIGQARHVLKILQTYYCERLGRAICIDVPTIFWAFFKLIQPFIDPVTKDKIRFIREPNEVFELVDPSQLIKEDYEGELDFFYDHDAYFSTLERICLQRRLQFFRNWQQLGSKIGESEYAIKTLHLKNSASPTASSQSTAAPAKETTSPPASQPEQSNYSLETAAVATGIENTHIDDASHKDAAPKQEEDKQVESREPASSVPASSEEHPLIATLPAENNYADVDPQASTDKSQADSSSQSVEPGRPAIAHQPTQFFEAPLADQTAVEQAAEQHDQVSKEPISTTAEQPLHQEATVQSIDSSHVSGVPAYLRNSVMQ